MTDHISNALNMTPLSQDILDDIEKTVANATKEQSPQKGSLNNFYGNTHTEESKKLMSEKATGRASPMKGKKHTQETKKKLSDAKRGKPAPWNKGREGWNKGKKTPEETRKKQSMAKMGHEVTEDVRKRLSEKHKNLPKKTCPHCGKKVAGGNYTRWHGDNCKHA